MILTCSSCRTQNRVPAARLTEAPVCGSCKAALQLDGPVEVTSEVDFDELTREAPLPVVVDFWAPWCGPCRMVGPEMVKLARAHAGKLLVAKVNTDELQGVAARLQINAIPTLALYRDGALVRAEPGARNQRGIEQLFGLA